MGRLFWFVLGIFVGSFLKGEVKITLTEVPAKGAETLNAFGQRRHVPSADFSPIDEPVVPNTLTPGRIRDMLRPLSAEEVYRRNLGYGGSHG